MIYYFLKLKIKVIIYFFKNTWVPPKEIRWYMMTRFSNSWATPLPLHALKIGQLIVHVSSMATTCYLNLFTSQPLLIKSTIFFLIFLGSTYVKQSWGGRGFLVISIQNFIEFYYVIVFPSFLAFMLDAPLSLI